ncbi:hypothetical protein ACFW1A_08025 [Kitasatospora sp. NPDC058965]|uniref:hypothetical protein n=1 Tax=Kitasatospora sp. NPDC058965 TaxID=3346682 RepID=UPI0036A5EF45
MSEQHGQCLTGRRIGAFGTSLLAAATLTWWPATAFAAPGDNGDVKIHLTTESQTDERDEPKVCAFYLAAFNFDTLTQVSWTISQQPPTGSAQVLAGDVTLTTGAGRSADLSLPDGHYKLEWTFTGEHGNGKQKVFEVSCATPSPSPSPTQVGTNPSPGTSPSPVGSTTGPAPSTSASSTTTGGSGPSAGGTPSQAGPGAPGTGPGSAPVGSVAAGAGGSVRTPNAAQIVAGSALIAASGWLAVRARRRARRDDAR